MRSPSAPPDRPRQLHEWERLDVETRRRIVERLTAEPRPWRFVVESVMEEFGVKRSALNSLIMTVVLYGPEDPFLLGLRSLDNPQHVDEARQRDEVAREAMRKEQRRRYRKGLKARKKTEVAAAELAQVVAPRVRKRGAGAV